MHLFHVGSNDNLIPVITTNCRRRGKVTTMQLEREGEGQRQRKRGRKGRERGRERERGGGGERERDRSISLEMMEDLFFSFLDMECLPGTSTVISNCSSPKINNYINNNYVTLYMYLYHPHNISHTCALVLSISTLSACGYIHM